MRPLQQILIIVIFINVAVNECSATCYFPPELEGSYLTQSTITENQVQYSEVNITGDSIPIWGLCHKRVGNNVILSSDETECYRCFNLKLVSKNILRVITTDPDFISKCYTNEEKALASCPSEEILLNPLNYTKIIHYKYLDREGTEIRYEYCPINGRYKFNYNNDDGKEDVIECVSQYSELDNCPSGSAMNLRFKECSFENHELRFECLGHWTDLDGRNYLALVNNAPHQYKSNGRNVLRPQYRCGVFKTDPRNGTVTIQFSRDSTCTVPAIKPTKTSSGMKKFKTSPNDSNNESNHHHSNTNSETLVLYPSNQNIYWPHENFCKFENWLQGEWQHISVKDDTFVFRDQISFKAYTMKCLEKNSDDTVLVYSRTQCDEESYRCLKIKYRSSNVIEFQVGEKSSSKYDGTLCSDEYFNETKWLTQGRLNETHSPCPVDGVLQGVIPDAPHLCAKLSSDCSSLDLMHYKVAFCNFDVLEEREYRCLGQWADKNLVFTYTRRLDIGTYECFVGGIKNEQTIFIKEAGEDCQRNIDPYKYGMELKQTETCARSFPNFPSTSMTTESNDMKLLKAALSTAPNRPFISSFKSMKTSSTTQSSILYEDNAHQYQQTFSNKYNNVRPTSTSQIPSATLSTLPPLSSTISPEIQSTSNNATMKSISNKLNKNSSKTNDSTMNNNKSSSCRTKFFIGLLYPIFIISIYSRLH